MFSVKEFIAALDVQYAILDKSGIVEPIVTKDSLFLFLNKFIK